MQTPLTKWGIIGTLKLEHNISIKSVQKLNKLLEEMGILRHFSNGWSTTSKGLKFSIYHSNVINADLWYPELVKEIADYLSTK